MVGINVKYISKYSMKNIAFGQCDAQNLMSCTIIDYMLKAISNSDMYGVK